MSTIKSSRYIGPIRQLVDEWDKRLTLLAKTIDEWIACQRRWLYLEQIFSTPDIQLTQETKIFVQVDKTWKELMRRTEQLPNALKAATQPGTLELLQTNNGQMEKIQRALEVRYCAHTHTHTHTSIDFTMTEENDKHYRYDFVCIGLSRNETISFSTALLS
jgi:uncharacterized NAD(P)/FAD-binding protein YdhS